MLRWRHSGMFNPSQYSVVINKPMQIYRDKLELEFNFFNRIIISYYTNDADEVVQVQEDFIDTLTDDHIEKVNDTIVTCLKDLCVLHILFGQNVAK